MRLLDGRDLFLGALLGASAAHSGSISIRVSSSSNGLASRAAASRAALAAPLPSAPSSAGRLSVLIGMERSLGSTTKTPLPTRTSM